MGVAREPPFRVFVHNACDVFNSHLCGSILHGEVREEAYGLSRFFVENSIYGCKLSFIEHSEARGVIFRFQ